MLVYREDVLNGFLFGLVMFTTGLAVSGGGLISGFIIEIGLYIIITISEALP